MHSTKRKIQTAAGTCSVVAGGLLTFATIVAFTMLGDIYGSWIPNYVYVIYTFQLLLAISVLLLGSILCKSNIKPDGSIKSLTGPAIAELVLTAVLTVLYIVQMATSYYNYMTVFMLLLCIAIVVLLITFLCIKNETNSAAPRQSPIPENPVLPGIVGQAPATPGQQKELAEKIAILKKLKEEGNITQEEFSKLLMKCLDNSHE